MTTPASPAAPRSSPAVTVGSFLVITLVWGSTWLVIKDQISAVPPAWTICWRFIVAGLAMIALATVRRESLRLPSGSQSLAAFVGLTQFLLNYQFVYHAEAYLTSGLVAVLFALLMVPNAVLSALFLGSPLTRRFLVGSAVAVGGIALLMLHEVRLAPVAGDIWMGIGLSTLGLLSASVANVSQASRRGRQCKPVPFLACAMLWGALFDAGWALISVGPPVLDSRPAYLGGVLYLAILGSVVPFPLYFKLIRDMGAGKAAYTSVATPVVAMILSTLYEGYHWTPLALGGSVLVLFGLLIALSARKA